jgi:ABC-2 type transport system permease protein
VRTARQPANVVSPLIFPMLLFAVNSGGLKAETRLPGFPTDSFLAFALAVPFVQGALLATVNANVEFARDIQTGFLNRLALTPVRAMVLLLGQLGGLLTIALVQAAFYLAVGLAFGVRLETGVAGALLLIVLEAVIALAFASFGSWAALRTGSTEAVQGLFPVFFVFLFLSSMNIPRNLIETTWFRWVTTLNPVSYLIESVRALVIYDWRWETIGLGFAVGGAMCVIGFALATHALFRRMERT